MNETCLFGNNFKITTAIDLKQGLKLKSLRVRTYFRVTIWYKYHALNYGTACRERGNNFFSFTMYEMSKTEAGGLYPKTFFWGGGREVVVMTQDFEVEQTGTKSYYEWHIPFNLNRLYFCFKLNFGDYGFFTMTNKAVSLRMQETFLRENWHLLNDKRSSARHLSFSYDSKPAQRIIIDGNPKKKTPV